jgi:hypothetical protein
LKKFTWAATVQTGWIDTDEWVPLHYSASGLGDFALGCVLLLFATAIAQTVFGKSDW